MKEKIEEILGRHERDDVFGITQELLHLIQEERKEAVEGFVDWFETSDEASEFRAVDGIASANLSGGLKEYLESEK